MYCVVTADGVSTENPELTIPTANEAKGRGIHILVVGITNQTDMNELIGIASKRENGQPGTHICYACNLLCISQNKLCFYGYGWF